MLSSNFYKMDLGPKPGVSLRVAVLAEGALTYLLNLVILYATSESPSTHLIFACASTKQLRSLGVTRSCLHQVDIHV